MLKDTNLCSIVKMWNCFFCFILLKYYLAEAIINMIAAITIINSSMPRRWFLGKYNSLRIINNINVADLLQH